MNKKILIFVSLFLMTTTAFSVTYEDGTSPQRWSTYTSVGGEISAENGAIKFVGSGARTGYYLPLDIDYTQGEIFSWKLNYTHYFRAYVGVTTTNGVRYLSYYPLDEELGKNGRFIQYALGRVRDGQWHTFSRDLQADLEKYEAGNRVLKINGFFIRGTGMVDDIELNSEVSYREIQQLMVDAIERRNNNVLYIISGDSTRNNSFNRMIRYYRTLLSKANIQIFNNAQASLSGKEWKNNSRDATLNKALEATVGNGANTIFEYSFGINDYLGRGDKARVKRELKEGLERYIQAKPQAKVFLVVPIITSEQRRNRVLKEIYEELADELNLPLVDAQIPTRDIYNSRFYEDRTHPNARGSRVIADYILNTIGNDLIRSTIFE